MAAIPLTDCTNAEEQAMNKDSNTIANGGTASAKAPPTPLSTTVKRVRHNPYAPVLSPEDSVESLMSSYPSPLRWAYSNGASPYESYSSGYWAAAYPADVSTPHLSSSQLPEDVSRPLFVHGGYPTYALPEASQNNTSPNTSTADGPPSGQRAGSTGTTPMKSLGRIYVGGRPKPVHRRHTADVTVTLRGGEASFRLTDVYAVFPPEVAVDALAGHYVIVEGDRGIDMGQIAAVLRSDVVEGETASTGDNGANDLPKVLRLADEHDMMCFDALDEAEEEALLHCRACITAARMTVPIHVERAIFQLDREKLTLQYTSDAYVDFKALTRTLHNHHKCRIWMHQLNREVVRANNSSGHGGDKRRGTRKGNGNGKPSGNRGRD